MYLLGMFVSEQFVAAGAGEVDDLDSSRTRTSAPSSTPRGPRRPDRRLHDRQELPIARRQPRRCEGVHGVHVQGFNPGHLHTANPGTVAAASDADTSAYSALQQKGAELIGSAQRITQFLDRDTNPNFAGPNGMQAFLLDFIQNPDQDLTAFTQKIQDFWDTL